MAPGQAHVRANVGLTTLLLEEAATRPNQNPSYAGFAQPSFASQYSDAQARVPHEPSTTEMPFIQSSTYESRGAGSYQAQFPFIDARSRHLPGPLEITSYLPSKGGSGDKLLINLRLNTISPFNRTLFFQSCSGADGAKPHSRSSKQKENISTTLSLLTSRLMR